MNTCNGCLHFHATDKDRLAGECHIYPPPTIIVIGADAKITSNWPKVDALDWCSQFMSRENLHQGKKKKK